MKKDKIFKKEISNIIKIIENLSKTKINNKTFFLTGCTGFFGIWILCTFNELIKKHKLNTKIYVLTRNKNIKKTSIYNLSRNQKIKFIFGDIQKFNFTNNIKNINYIIHGATTSAEETFKGQNFNKKKKIIINGTKKVLRNAKKFNCNKIFYFSSGAVYKNLDKNRIIKETDPIYKNTKFEKKDHNISVLGKSKAQAEKLIISFCKKNKIKYTIGRFFTFVGPYMPINVHYAIGNFIHSKINKRKIILKSDGKSKRSYMYIADCITYFFLMLFGDKNNHIYNVGSDKKISIKELAILVDKITTKKDGIKIDQKNKTTTCYIPSTKKIRKDFPKFNLTSINKSISKTFDHISQYKNIY